MVGVKKFQYGRSWQDLCIVYIGYLRFFAKKLDLSEYNGDISCEIKNSYSRCVLKSCSSLQSVDMMSFIVDNWLRIKVIQSLRDFTYVCILYAYYKLDYIADGTC